MSQSQQHVYYLGIGSNTNRRENIQSCLNYFLNSFTFCEISPVYRSAAFGFKGPDFFNLVTKIQTAFKPSDLKFWTQQIENIHGRDRSKPRYSNRTLDIDLLLCDDLVIDDGFVQIPRREILKRPYVLKPLQDLAPDLIHPLVQKRLVNLWQALMVSNQSSLELVDDIFTYQRCHHL